MYIRSLPFSIRCKSIIIIDVGQFDLAFHLRARLRALQFIGAVAMSVERATPAQEVIGLFPAPVGSMLA